MMPIQKTEIFPFDSDDQDPTTPLKFKQSKRAIYPGGKGINGTNHPPTFEFQTIPDVKEGMEDAYLKTVSTLTGTLSEVLGQQLLRQAIHATHGAKEIVIEAEAVSAALGEMKPQDAIEGMIITQIVSLHNQMMHYMRLAIEEEFRAEEYTSRFLKLNRQFLATLNGLLKYRNRGQQNVVVQNVSVAAGGGAVVGYVQSPLQKEVD